jgi:hypothetical protein
MHLPFQKQNPPAGFSSTIPVTLLTAGNNKAGTQGHRLRAMDSVGASEGGTPGAKDPGVERWVSWGTSGGADGVPSKLTARSQAVEDCWSRGLRSARS